MKRTKQQQLEYESMLALRCQLPLAWIVRDQNPDVGIDLKIEIVEGEEVTNKALSIQNKATEKGRSATGIISFQMQTNHLIYYENAKIPVIIVYGFKKSRLNFDFYYVFAQKYIREVLNDYSPNWREQKTKAVRFNELLPSIDDWSRLVTDWHLYVFENQPSPTGAQSSLNGIPKSDDQEIKKRTLNALLHMRAENYPPAIEELESILRTCMLSQTERISILLLLGNAYYNISNYDKAMENYEKAREITEE